MWNIATTYEFDSWFAGLPREARNEVAAKVSLLRIFGPELRRPHADTLNGSRHSNLKELRASTSDKVLRIAFAFDPTRAAILLVAGDKSGVAEKRFYRQLIAKADELYDRHLKTLKANKKRR
jgi:hypothetical protein